MSPYKPIPLETAAYKFGGGVETKVHGMSLPPPKLQRCENAYVDESGSIRRRFGRSALVDSDVLEQPITGDWVALGKHQDRLLGFKQDKVYDYGEPDSRWADRGRCVSWKQETNAVDSVDLYGAGPRNHDMAVIGQYKCYVFESLQTAPNTFATRFTLVDDKGTRYASGQLLGVDSTVNHFSALKVVAWQSQFYIVYPDGRDPGKLKCFIINTANAGSIASSLLGAPTDLAVDYPVSTLNGTLDLIVDQTYGPVIAYKTTTANRIKIAFINSAGLQTGASASVVTAADPRSCSLATSDTGNFAVAYHVVGGASTDVYCQLWNYNGTAWSLLTAPASLFNSLTVQWGQPSVIFDSPTVARIFHQDIAGTPSTYPFVRQTTLNTAGASNSGPSQQRALLVARPWKEQRTGMIYMAVMLDQLVGPVATPTMFICTYTGLPTGVMSAGIAAYHPNYYHNPGGTYIRHALPHVVGSRQHENDWGADPDTYRFMSDQYSRLVATGFQVGIGSQSNIVEMVIRAVDHTTHCTVENNECTYIAGGMLQQYDAVGCTEVNFLHPLNTLASHVTLASAVGGALTPGEYSYQFVPEWINAQGVREQGTNLGSVVFTLAAASSAVDITLDMMPYTLKKTANGRSNLVIAVYRSLVGTTAKSQHFRVGQIENAPASTVVAKLPVFKDIISDTIAREQEMCYLDSGILDNVPPGAGGHIIASGNGRVFVAGFPDDPNMVRYSKERGHDEGLAFNEALTILVPKAHGAITALAVMNESLIAFTEHGVFRTNGDGLNNTGTQGGFIAPVQTQTESGAIDMRGTIMTPGGVLFKTRKGMMMLRTSFVMDYIGSSLEKLTDPGPCTGCQLIPQLQQARVSYKDVTHVFDYFHKEWYVFTHGADGPTAVVNDRLYAISGPVTFDDQDSGTDVNDQYIVTLQLAWFHAEALLSDLMVRKIGLTGRTKFGGMFLTVIISNDQRTFVQQRIERATVGAINLQWRVARRVLSQIQVTLTDAVVDDFSGLLVTSGDPFTWDELTFEIGKRSPTLGRGRGDGGDPAR